MSVLRRYESLVLALIFSGVLLAQSQDSDRNVPGPPARNADRDYGRERSEWFSRGRIVSGLPSAELRHRAYQAKLKMRAQPVAARVAGANPALLSAGSWIPLGPVPLASDASGNGMQDYRQVAGRVTAVAIDPADATGNTVYIGAAQGGVWKSTNAAYSVANNVAWTPLTDNQATLSIGAIAIQEQQIPDVTKSVILAATGEANNAADSYFGLGILRSTDAGNTWSLVSTANNGALSFNGLGGTRMAFKGQSNVVVSAMGASSEGLIDGAVSANTKRGLYTSLNAGQSWTYNALVDPGGATDATSATSVVYNSTAGLFYAAIRYHGFYSSTDGITWTRLANQPGGTMLSATACPPQSTANNRGCPMYRGEISVVPGRNEMYVWYVFLDSYGNTQDGGIWKSVNGGAGWTAISDAGISNCGDIAGCGVEQGSYNFALLAVANGAATDLYAGAVNIYKCAINSTNPTCTSAPFMNLTHVYGCVPAGAPAHVHPAQHAMAAMIPRVGADSGNELLYFANDGGVYRTLNGFSGLTGGSCSALNQFDDLNQNLGSLAQFISFSQHPSDRNTLLGGTQGNGSAATSAANSSTAWLNVLGGDGAYSAIDPSSTSNWYASNPDLPPGGLGIQLCSSGVNCRNSGFNFVVNSDTVGGDDGGFYFPYILDSGSTTAMLVGTCRVWRGARTGGAFTALSPNFENLGSGTCSGAEVNQVRSLATAGPTTSSSGSSVIYATTSGLGPIQGPLTTPAGGRVWVTTDASTGTFGFADVTDNGPDGNINPNQFPISSVAADLSDETGNIAYVGIMGFTGGTGHVWKTTNGGTTWTDFTANLPDSPVNAVVVYPALAQVYVGTDVGVFASSTSTADWTELGPNPATNRAGFLPNVAVTALRVFASGGQLLLRASTYGRGIWEFNLVVTPDFQMSVASPTLTVFPTQTAVFTGTITALNGYANSLTLSCIAGSSAAPSVCSPSPVTLSPASKTPFSVSTSSPVGDYNFKIQAVGSDSNRVTHNIPLALHVVNFGMTAPSPASVTVPRGTASQAVNFEITASGSFDQSVSVACSTTIPNATCNLTPGTTVNPTSLASVDMTASVNVPATTAPGSYSVTLQATSAGAPAALTASFALKVTSNPHFDLTVPVTLQRKAGDASATGGISITSEDSFAGTVSLSCTSSHPGSSCSIVPSSASSFPASATLTVQGVTLAAGSYTLGITGTSGALVQRKEVTLNVGDFSISGAQTLWTAPGGEAPAALTLASLYGYSGTIDFSCDLSALAAALCSVSPNNPISLASGGTKSVSVIFKTPKDAAPGTYNLTINSLDDSGSPGHSFAVALTIGEDFVLSSSTASQTVRAGQTSGAYNLTIQPMGASFNAAVTLACTKGLPAGAQCNFSPSTPITPGASAINVVMSISTQGSGTASSRGLRGAVVLAASLFMPALLWVFASPRRGHKSKGRFGWMPGIVLTVPLLLILASCSGVSAQGGGGTTLPPGNPVTYQVTVRASSPGLPDSASHSAIVTLIVD
ncbi:MAG TPA: hypothetical protein VF123_12660 [Candidatus Sulfotelmatobacter sp.]